MEAPALDRVGEISRLQTRHDALLDAVVGIAAGLDLRGVLERIVTAACRLAGARYGALGVLSENGRWLAEFVAHGVTPEQWACIGAPPEGHGILGLLIDRPEPLRLAALSEHPTSFGFPEHHPPMGTFLGVPIRVGERVFGNLYLAEKLGGGEFTDEDEEIVVALSAAAGVAVENARLYEQSAQRERWLAAAAEISGMLLGDVDRKAALRLVARRARELAGVNVAVIALRRPAAADEELRVEVADGPGAADLEGATPPLLELAAGAWCSQGRRAGGVTLTRTSAPGPPRRPTRAAGVTPVRARHRTRCWPRWRVPPAYSASCWCSPKAGRGGPSPTPTCSWSRASRRRLHWRWSGRRPGGTGPCSRCSRSGSGSPAICTTW